MYMVHRICPGLLNLGKLESASDKPPTLASPRDILHLQQSHSLPIGRGSQIRTDHPHVTKLAPRRSPGSRGYDLPLTRVLKLARGWCEVPRFVLTAKIFLVAFCNSFDTMQ